MKSFIVYVHYICFVCSFWLVDCSEHSFRCQNKVRCVMRSLLCDGRNDCGDNSDETTLCGTSTVCDLCASRSVVWYVNRLWSVCISERCVVRQPSVICVHLGALCGTSTVCDLCVSRSVVWYVNRLWSVWISERCVVRQPSVICVDLGALCGTSTVCDLCGSRSVVWYVNRLWSVWISERCVVRQPSVICVDLGALCGTSTVCDLCGSRSVVWYVNRLWSVCISERCVVRQPSVTCVNLGALCGNVFSTVCDQLKVYYSRLGFPTFSPHVSYWDAIAIMTIFASWLAS